MQFMKNPILRMHAKLDRDSQKITVCIIFDIHTRTHFIKIGEKIVKLSDDSFKGSILFSCLKKGERIIDYSAAMILSPGNLWISIGLLTRPK